MKNTESIKFNKGRSLTSNAFASYDLSLPCGSCSLYIETNSGKKNVNMAKCQLIGYGETRTIETSYLGKMSLRNAEKAINAVAKTQIDGHAVIIASATEYLTRS